MNDETRIMVTLSGFGTFELTFHPIAGSGGVEEVRYTGSVFVERQDDDKDWSFLNRCVEAIRSELGVKS